jgi:hypothetical protein
MHPFSDITSMTFARALSMKDIKLSQSGCDFWSFHCVTAVHVPRSYLENAQIAHNLCSLLFGSHVSIFMFLHTCLVLTFQFLCVFAHMFGLDVSVFVCFRTHVWSWRFSFCVFSRTCFVLTFQFSFLHTFGPNVSVVSLLTCFVMTFQYLSVFCIYVWS